ncbi:HAMP domain-containing sensor histidine kinase [Xanthocytophaga agilis]|uniref:histidine kinase n=1 Tax=Xanthocytophaga agilis TaxID=3048010 RepID=A0AAE3R192_9BACT|nr:HAMP domain-containing sensor histidine kinase [Xanthocytophaga agilis]MDJ1501869.1 HAMP domain-containing sensor histidine kinase [Xanthocytophaga agilis]
MEEVDQPEAMQIANHQQFINWESLSKELEKVTFELNTLTYRLSHDFNAPLSSILGLIDLIELEHGDIASQYLHMMRGRINRMRDIIRDLVYSSRMQNQTSVLENADLSTIIQREILELSDLNNYHKLKITTQISGDCPVRTDLFRLRIILNCLVSNSINYANLINKKPTVKVHVKCSAKDLQILIKDNGIGIPQEQQIKVFEMFYRGTHASNGSGLGLFLVQKAVHQMNGTITLKSESGKGTTVKVTIPNHFS